LTNTTGMSHLKGLCSLELVKLGMNVTICLALAGLRLL